MTLIRKPVRRESLGTIYDGGRARPVIIALEPPNIIRLSLKGTRREPLTISTEGLYMALLKSHLGTTTRKESPCRARTRRPARR